MEDNALISLSEALAKLDREYNSNYSSPEAILALRKTIKTFNITIVDWNTLLNNISTAGSTLKAIYEIIPKLAETVFEQQRYVDEKISDFYNTAYRDRGSVANYSSLPENPQIGDTYNLAETGDNFMWNGAFWDKLSGDIIAGSGVSVNNNTISSLTTATDVVINLKD